MPARRTLRLVLGLGAMLLAACTGQGAAPGAAPPPDPAVAAEAARLREAMLSGIPGAARPDPAQAARWVALAREAMAAAGQVPPRAELAVLVDRAPSVQRIALLLLRAEGPWEVLASAPAATGARGRQGYFVTPTGVFVHDGAILGYRALGTPNALGVRGLGARGARVWDFGWQPAERGWREDGSQAEIRFLLHATDPALLEPRLGQPGSQGCVRIGGAMNRFLDHHGVLDVELERMAAEDRRAAALLPPDRQPTSLAGRMLIVVDSEQRPAGRRAERSAPEASCAA